MNVVYLLFIAPLPELIKRVLERCRRSRFVGPPRFAGRRTDVFLAVVVRLHAGADIDGLVQNVLAVFLFDFMVILKKNIYKMYNK